MNSGDDKKDGSENPDTERIIAAMDDRIDSRELFIGAREIEIVHGDDVYKLRLTFKNRLILTKVRSA